MPCCDGAMRRGNRGEQACDICWQRWEDSRSTIGSSDLGRLPRLALAQVKSQAPRLGGSDRVSWQGECRNTGGI